MTPNSQCRETLRCTIVMTEPNEWEARIQEIIEGFPDPYKEEILELYIEWIETNPDQQLYQNWADYCSKIDAHEALYTERRVYLKRVTNELRVMEIPLKRWQKVAKALAAVASIFLVVFLAISRAMRVTE